MGLDITAFSGLKSVNAVYNHNGELVNPITRALVDVDFIELYANPAFPMRELPFTDGPYTFVKSMSCFYSSYSEYGRWREELAKIAGYPRTQDKDLLSTFLVYSQGCWAATEGPFFELINFSDAEGVLGTIVLKKLLLDFETYDDAAKKSKLRYFYTKYKLLMEGIRFASIDGALVFHILTP